MKRIKPPGWNEEVTYPRYVWGELWMWGGKNGGYAESSRLMGALKLLRRMLPSIDIDRGKQVSFYDFDLFSVPTRTCDEAELWTLGLHVTRNHGQQTQWKLVRGPE